MKKLKLILLASIVGLCALISACSTSDEDPGAKFHGQSEAKIYQDGKKAMLKGDYEDAAAHFAAINADYPFGKFAQQSRLNAAYCYYKNNNNASALAAANNYIRLYPRGAHIDYAYYLRGMIQVSVNRGPIETFFGVDFTKRDLSSLKAAFIDFDHLVRLHPHSHYAADARARMIYIRNQLAKQELHIAQFYYDRAAYVAAINRANTIITQYQQTPVVEPTLALLVKANRKLNLTKDADENLSILQLNFPNSKYLKKLS